MGMYAYLDGTEIKYSGLLAQAGNPIAKPVNGVVSFDRGQMFDLAYNLAQIISDTRVAASDIAGLRDLRIACDKLETIVLWLDRGKIQRFPVNFA